MQETKQIISRVLIMLVYIGIGVGIVCSIILPTWIPYQNDEYTKKQYDIASLEVKQQTSGTFVLGCGNFNSEEYYYFYTTTDKGYKLEKEKTKYTYIVETEEFKPSVYEIKKKKQLAYYVIYVPVGTIVKEFKG